MQKASQPLQPSYKTKTNMRTDGSHWVRGAAMVAGVVLGVVLYRFQYLQKGSLLCWLRSGTWIGCSRDWELFISLESHIVLRYK